MAKARGDSLEAALEARPRGASSRVSRWSRLGGIDSTPRSRPGLEGARAAVSPRASASRWGSRRLGGSFGLELLCRYLRVPPAGRNVPAVPPAHGEGGRLHELAAVQRTWRQGTRGPDVGAPEALHVGCGAQRAAGTHVTDGVGLGQSGWLARGECYARLVAANAG